MMTSIQKPTRASGPMAQNMIWGLARAAMVLAMIVPAVAASAQTVCTVPSPSKIQAVIDLLACSTINLPSANYTESIRVNRSVTILGTNGVTDLAGFIAVQGPDVEVSIENLRIVSGCNGAALWVTDGAHVQATDVELDYQVGLPCPQTDTTVIFANGFEAGNPAAWSAQVN